MRLVVLLLGHFLGGLFMISMVLRGVINGVVCMQIAAFVGHLFSVNFSFLQEVSALMSRRLFLDEE
jgi:hypothetical protein